MKLVSFRRQGRDGFGAVLGDGVVDLSGVFLMETRFTDLRELLAAGAVDLARETAEGAEPDFGLTDMTYRLPIPRPTKILCIGRNYRAYHEVVEDGAAPKWPSVFARFVESFAPHGEPILKPRESDQLDYEGELAVVIGRQGRRIAEADALSYVGGYTCLNEGSVRDWQDRGTQNCPGKNFYRSGSIGPWMATADEIPDPTKLRIVTRVNGETRQDGGVDRMIFDIPFLISHISRFIRLNPGDVIATGSPGGSAVSMDPPAWLRPGDKLEVEIAGVGALDNPIEAE